MASTDEKDRRQIISENQFDRWLVRLLTALAVGVGIFIFVLCGGWWVVGFIAFALVLYLWGESHILPWMFFIAVVDGLVWLWLPYWGIHCDRR